MQSFIWQNSEIFHMVGWTLIHSLWQALLLALIARFFLWAMDKGKSNIRYSLSVGILFSMLVCTVFTFMHEYSIYHTGQVQPLSTGLAHRDQLNAVANPDGKAFYPTDPAGLDLAGLITLISPYFTICWIIGMVFFSARILMAGIKLRRYRGLISAHLPAHESIIGNLAAAMGIQNMPRLIISEAVEQPFTFGHFKPVILLPFSYAMQTPVAELELILAHELSHIKRFDYLVNLGQSAMGIIYFFNPCIQYLSQVVRTEREYCCDDMASKLCGDGAHMAIALTNLKVATSRSMLVLAAKGTNNHFHSRVLRLLKPTSDGRFSIMGSVLSFVVLSGLIIFLVNCGDSRNRLGNPSPSEESLKQLFTDNQAGHKFQVFAYTSQNKTHEVVLVSTPEGKALYGYLDGSPLEAAELDKIVSAIQRSSTISKEELASMKPSAREQRSLRMSRVSEETGNLWKLISTTEQSKAKLSRAQRQQLDSLKNELNTSVEIIKALSMENYEEDVANIPIDVQLHELLTNMITRKEYTSAQREQLNTLVSKRQQF